MSRNRWVLFFSLYGVAICTWFAYVSYTGAAGPSLWWQQRAYNQSGSAHGVRHK